MWTDMDMAPRGHGYGHGATWRWRLTEVHMALWTWAMCTAGAWAMRPSLDAPWTHRSSVRGDNSWDPITRGASEALSRGWGAALGG